MLNSDGNGTAADRDGFCSRVDIAVDKGRDSGFGHRNACFRLLGHQGVGVRFLGITGERKDEAKR
ncbi:hypothetical protein [Microbulbifer sp. JMSA008]|uniref:hypothetical protein n=1 Tax=Microbulbifer sp. JMSA008 TaxID=3243373 RepID=UPI004039690D